MGSEGPGGASKPWWTRENIITTRTNSTSTSASNGNDAQAAEDAKARVQSSVLATFGSWFAAQGGKIHEKVRMVYRPNAGWALEADENISKGEKLVFLPSSLMMSCDDEEVSAPLRRVVDSVPSELWSSKVGLVLLRERVAGQHSKYAPYINLLPSVHEGSPMFYPPDAIREIQYAPLVAQINKRCRFLVSFFGGKSITVDDGEEFVDGVHPNRRRVEMTIDANALGWASACASSRAFKVRGPTQTPSMLPVIDICNHSFQPSAEVSGTEGGVELVTTRDLRPGEPIELSYGNLSNDDLLLDYGFIVEDNPHDTVKLRWDLKLIELAREIGGLGTAPVGAAAAKDGKSNAGEATLTDSVMTLTDWQKAALQRIGLVDDANVELNVLATGQVIDKKALAGLRVLYSRTPSEASRAADAPYGELDADIVSKDTEIKALRTSMSLVALALGNFPTKLDEDLSLLASAPTPQHRLAVRFRAEKKKLLNAAMAKLSDAISRAQRAAS